MDSSSSSELAVTIAKSRPGTQWHRREGGQFGSQHAILCPIGGGWRSKWPVYREKSEPVQIIADGMLELSARGFPYRRKVLRKLCCLVPWMGMRL